MPKECKTILLVEDEVVIAMAEAQRIKSFGYEVITASSGEKAINIATENRKIDLVLMDINLGVGIDGTEAARRILGMRNIPIVFLTTRLKKECAEKLKGISNYGYLSKNTYAISLHSYIDASFGLQTRTAEYNEN